MRRKLLVVIGDRGVEQDLLARLPQLGCEVHVARRPEDVERLVRTLAPEASGSVSCDPSTCVCTQGLEIDALRFRCFVLGRELRLTLTEFRILYTLARSEGLVFTRQKLSEACLGVTADGQQRTIDVHIKTLRQKLGEQAHLVETVRGVGYRFHEEEAEHIPRSRATPPAVALSGAS